MKIRKSRGRFALLIVGLGVGLVVLLLVSMGVGAKQIPVCLSVIRLSVSSVENK